ncbi:hypothetical protein Mapa_006217 [Marchantia paleacea]|nr:hypothetical protein Mapa_006217 [Marchantia paleacea]
MGLAKFWKNQDSFSTTFALGLQDKEWRGRGEQMGKLLSVMRSYSCRFWFTCDGQSCLAVDGTAAISWCLDATDPFPGQR